MFPLSALVKIILDLFLMNLLVIFIRSMIWMFVDSIYNDFDIRLNITGMDLFLISFCVIL